MERAQRAPAPASGPPGERELLHLMDVLGAVTPVGRGEAGDLAPSAHATRPAPRPPAWPASRTPASRGAERWPRGRKGHVCFSFGWKRRETWARLYALNLRPAVGPQT